jgi:hypothetical protein
MKGGRIHVILSACLLGAALFSCTNGYISREDMYWMASTSPEIRLAWNDVEIPAGTGSFDFGSLAAGDIVTRTFTVHNDGEQALFVSGAAIISGDTHHFILDTLDLSSRIEQGDSSSFSITFDPRDNGSMAATVVIHNNDLDESPYTFAITGEGNVATTPQPVIQVLKGEAGIVSGAEGHDFGTVQQGYASIPVTFTIRNAGDADLSVSGIAVNDTANFGIDDGSLKTVLAPGEGTWFSVTFTPTVEGTASATVSIDNTDNGSFTFTVTGMGSSVPEPDISVSYAGGDLWSGTGFFDFGTVELWKKSAPVTFSIRNTGNAALEVYSVQLQSGTPSFIPNTISMGWNIPGGGMTSFPMIFKPDMSGSVTDEVEIHTNDPESPYTFTVEGTGSDSPVPDIRVVEKTWYPHGSRYDFGAVKVGQKSSVKLYIENPGSAPLQITNVLLTEGDQDDYTLDLTKTSLSVLSGTSTYFTATFTPTKAGERSRMLEIHSDDPDVPTYAVGLGGFGQ